MVKKIKIGTDCSGIEAPIQALKQLKIPYRHVWSSETDKYCIESIKANYNPEILYGDPNGPYPNGDITKRDNSDLPNVDLYVCGFPCQPFSSVGPRKGLKDKRGNVFWSCLDVIKKKKPKYFILENVKGILSNDKKNKKDKYGKTWNIIWSELESLKDYNVQWKVLNTRDYGIPQNRERVYIVGIKKMCKKKFTWSKKKKMKNIKEYVDKNFTISFKTSDRLHKFINKHKENTFIELQHCSFHQNTLQNSLIAPCITAHTRMWW